MSTPHWGRLIVAGLLTASTCLLGAGPAAAHDALIGSTPEDGGVVSTAPSTVVLEFFDPIGQISPAMVLRDDQDEVVKTLDPIIDDRILTGELPTGLSDGTYSVAWRVVSDDGHPVQGITRFAIGEPSTSMSYSGGEATGSSRTGASAGSSIWIAVAVGAVPAVLAIVLLVLRRRAGRSTTA